MARQQIAVAVVVHGGRVLVGRRSTAAADAAGMDEFPGGKVQPGETPAAAVIRECAEEAGIAITVVREIATVASMAATGPIDVAFFASTPAAPAAIPRPPFAWMPIAAVPRLRFPRANAAAIAWLMDAAPLTADHGLPDAMDGSGKSV